MYKQRFTFLLKISEPICFYALNILLKSSRCPFIKIEVSLDNLKILSLQSQFWSILKRARTFYSDNVHTFKDRLIVVLQHYWSAAFILCDLCCLYFWDKSGFIGTLQSWESIFGSMESKHRYNVQLSCWNHLLKNAIESFRFLFKDTARLLSWAGEKKMGDFKGLAAHLGKKWSLQNSLNLFGPLCSFDLRLRRKLWIQS